MIPDRYPDSDILAQRGHWDQATRKVIMDRVHAVPTFRYFNEQMWQTLEALCDCVIPQKHRLANRKVPIAPWIDQRCSQGIGSGFRSDDMPPGPLAWEWGLQGPDETAQALFSVEFAELESTKRRAVLEIIALGNPPGEIWQRMPARRWWVYLALREIAGTYYSHPYAWDEIGFGGPAYTRGYFALNNGAREPWEAPEVAADAGAQHGRRAGR